MPDENRALFIVPPTGAFIREDRCQTPIADLKTVALRPPTDLMYCAAAFEARGARCQLRDYPAEGLAWDDLRRDLEEFRPRFLVLSITTPSLAEDLRAAALAKEVDPRILTIAKGAHFNTYDVRTLEEHPALDAVFRGEYEETCMELAAGAELADVAGLTWRDATGEIRRNPDRGFIEDLDAVPFPARNLVRNELYVTPDTGEMQTTLVTNRGCPHSCIYCLAPQVGGSRNRYRSVANVLAEIDDCIEKHGIRNFLFRSDLFTQNREWVRELCREIVERELDVRWVCNSRVDTIDAETLDWMKRAHCWLIAYGVESGVPETLERINKKATAEQAREAIALTKAAGIYTSVYMLLGLPWETEAEIERNLDFFVELDPDFLEIFYLYPFPGTPLYDMLVADGLLQAGEIPREAYGQPAYATAHMTKAELARWRRRALRRMYLRPAFVWKTLRKARSPVQLFNYLKYGLIQLADFVRKR